MKKHELFFIYSLAIAAICGVAAAITVHPLAGMFVGALVLPFTYSGMIIVCGNSKRPE